MVKNLFDNDDSNNEDISKIEIDEEFARRYEHNKKREDLQRYEELLRRGEIEESDAEPESESSDEEEDDEINKLSKKEDIKLFENLIKIKERDPSVYQAVNLFESKSDSEDGDDDMEDENKDTKKKPKYLKDVVAQHLIEEGPEFDEDVESKKMKKTYVEEQEELKKEFLDAVKNIDADDGGDLLKVKENKHENEVDDDDDDGEFQKKLGEYFGPDDALDENSKFLKDFFEKQMWIDRENKNSLIEDDLDVDDDDAEVWRQMDFEADYNFRYQENAGDRVMSHSRTVEGSVRKEKNPRKDQRKNKLERMKIAEMERQEELKHLKNVKKKEMDDNLKKVLDVAGLTNKDGFELVLDNLEEDFDASEYDKKMKKLFGDEYYNTNDPDPKFCSDDDDDGDDDDGDIEKPDFDKEDELLGLPKGWGAAENDDGFLAARKRALEKIPENDDHEEEDEEEEAEEEEEEEEEEEDDDDDDKEEEEQRGTVVEKNEEIVKKRKRKEKISLVKKAYEAMLDEYYKLDYEGTVGDLKTRFKYAKVKPNSFGLKTEEVLMLDDKDLNQYVSVKKIAPYREDEWKVPSNIKMEYRKKVKELISGKSKNHGRNSKTKSSRDNGDKTKSVSGKEKQPELEDTNMDVANLSHQQKRKNRQKELKPSQARIAAYQNAQTKKRKH